MAKKKVMDNITKSECREIKKKGTIPYSVLQKRLDICAKKAGLKKGYFSPDQEIKKLLMTKGRIKNL